MTEPSTETETEDFDNVVVKVELYPSGSEVVGVRQVALGLSALALIEVDVDDDDNLVYTFTGSLLDSVDELLEQLEGALTFLKDAVAQQAEEGQQ